VVAELVGVLKSRLSEIERGECVLDRISEIVALASALQIAPKRADEAAGASTGQRAHRQHCEGLAKRLSQVSPGSWEPQPV
jgi:hypothetical protein